MTKKTDPIPETAPENETVPAPSYSAEQSRRFVDLAFDCMFINEYEKEETLKTLETEAEEGSPPPSALEIFQQEKIISDENVEFLIEFDAHIQTQIQDQIFAQIASANGMAPPKEIEKALEYQKTYFNETGVSLTLGDILVNNRIITPEDRASILLTQDRIKNENLLDALNDLGKNKLQKEAVNKRFGVLAIKNEKVTREQVNEALEIQKTETSGNKSRRFIGKILQEIAGLSSTDILQILEEQKQFEKRRLDLEKALYSGKSEIKISKKLNKFFTYTISKDGVEAFAQKKKQPDEPISVYEFLIWIKRVGIRFGITNDAVLEDFIQNGEKDSKILIAKGNPAEPPVDERLELYFKDETAPDPPGTDTHIPENSDPESPEQEEISKLNDPEQEKEPSSGPEPDEGLEPDEGAAGQEEEQNPQDGPDEIETPEDQDTDEQDETQAPPPGATEDDEDKDDDEENEIIQIPAREVIKKGNILARILPGQPGKTGKDVKGLPIYPPSPAVCQWNAGKGVVRKNLVFFSLINGYPIIKHGNTLLMDPVEEDDGKQTITGNLKEDTQKTYEKATLEIKGDITPEAVLRCHSLLLHGSLTGSVVSSGDIEVKGDIGTAEKSDPPLVHGADIICIGSVQASKSIIQSRVQAFGSLSAYHCPVIGSDILAYQGMTIKDVINGEDRPSILQFGLKPGDKILGIDHKIATKKKELSVLKKESEIQELTQGYERDLAQEEQHQIEQAILKNLLEILQAPELDLVEGLDAKIEHLYRLPEFSSIRTYYLKLPETDSAWEFINGLITSTRKITQEEMLDHIQKKIAPEPEDEEAISETHRIETDFKARLAGFDQEVDSQSEEIEASENEIKKLEKERAEQEVILVKSLSRSTAAIKIRNQCEKGTVIKGKIAELIMDQTVYHVKFKEVQDPRTGKVSIIIDAY